MGTSCTCEPGRPAPSTPSPIATALQAGMLPVAAQAGWHALRDHGKDAAERVAAFARRVDGRDHRLAGFPIGRADRRGFDDIPRDCCGYRGFDRADGPGIAPNPDA